jgi:putative ABC transport system permease protein
VRPVAAPPCDETKSEDLTMTAPTPPQASFRPSRQRRRRWEALLRDSRFGLRTLRRSAGYTCAAVGVLALGIGANSAMFSVIHGVLLRPLPFRDGERLMLVQQSAPAAGLTNAGVAIPELAAYRQRLSALRDLVEYHGMSFTLLDRGEPDRVDTGVVSANFFAVLGIKPLHGRGFVDGDDDHGAEAVLILSHEYWQQKFGGDRRVVGQVVEMNDRPHTIVGVLPDFPQYPRRNDVYMPSSACPFRDQAGQTLPGGFRSFAALTVFGRLAPGASFEGAAAQVAAVSATFVKEHAEDYQQARDLAGRVEPLKDTLVRGARPLLLALAGTTLLVLLIACANVANLSIARTAARRRELALRSAMGAGRGRLLAQLLTENVLVALAGGALGVGLAWLSQEMLIGFVGRFTARTGEVAIDGRVLAFTLVVSLLTGLVFGSAPALLLRRNLMPSLREGTAQAGGGAPRQRLRAGLVVAQVAVSFVLLVGAALLLRSFHRLATVDLGYDGERVMSAAFFGNFTTINQNDALRINSQILDRLRAAPGVQSAAVTTAVPLSNIQPGVVTIRLDDGQGEDGTTLQIDPNVASDGYFETLGIPLLAGRGFRRSDDAGTPSVAVINRSLAQRWRGREALGARFIFAGGQPPPGQDPWVTVVGIVGDFQLYEPGREVPPQVYLTYRQSGGFAGRVMARTAGDPRHLAPAIRSAVHAVDPKSPVEEVQTVAELRRGQLATPQLTAALLGAFAAVALLVTLSGIAGVVGTSVTQRTRELGVRMALGATRGSVLRLVIGEGFALVAVGLLLGLGGALAFSRLVVRFLFATPPTDPLTYSAVGVVFVLAALLAVLAPARRATAIPPQVAFRTE